MSLELNKFSFHSISVKDDTPVARTIDGDAEDVSNYVKHVITEVTTPPQGQQNIRGQYFNFKSMTERVANNLKILAFDDNNEIWEEKIVDNANKLLEVEKDTQTEIQQLKKNIRKGCLLQIKCILNDIRTLLLVKIDDHSYLDAEIMKLKTGLPLDTRMQKVAIVKFHDSGTLESLLLSDTNSTISKYWRADFLEAEALRDSRTNTTNAFKAIDKLLNKAIKPKSKQDYYFIRNQVIIKFRQESFTFNELFEDIKKYEPIGEGLDKSSFDDFVVKLEKLPQDKVHGFDTQFDIEPKIIKAKLNNRIMIDDSFELLVKGEVSDLKSRLGVGIEDGTQRKFVKIYSDEGYNTFEPDFGQRKS